MANERKDADAQRERKMSVSRAKKAAEAERTERVATHGSKRRPSNAAAALSAGDPKAPAAKGDTSPCAKAKKSVTAGCALM